MKNVWNISQSRSGNLRLNLEDVSIIERLFFRGYVKQGKPVGELLDEYKAEWSKQGIQEPYGI